MTVGRQTKMRLGIAALAVLALCPLSAAAQGLFAFRAEPVPEAVEAMYRKGLEFLVRTQNKSGHWQETYGQQPGVVGLAVLAMLAYGEDPNFGPHASSIKAGLNAILKQQKKENGYIGNSMYNHGFAALALAEAYGAVDDPRLGPALQRAVDLLLSTQAKNSRNAWRYSPTSNDADTTVSGACLVALLAARNAGIGIPQPSIDKALGFYRQCQSGDGGFGYTNASSSSPPRGAIGALVLALSKRRETPNFKAAMRYLRGAGIQQSYHYYYYLYYASQAFFHAGPTQWEPWNASNLKRLAATQGSDGSWPTNLGPTFGTSAALLSLALNYRFLPIYER